jgi:putative copper export protein
MILAGLWLALIISDGPGGLFGTPYGRLLLLKTAVITGALALGAYNKVRVTDQIGSREATSLTHLRRTLSLELILFVSALVAVAAATTVFGPHS